MQALITSVVKCLKSLGKTRFSNLVGIYVSPTTKKCQLVIGARNNDNLVKNLYIIIILTNKVKFQSYVSPRNHDIIEFSVK